LLRNSTTEGPFGVDGVWHNSAQRVNDNGFVLGNSDLYGIGSYHTFLYGNGVTTDIGALFPRRSVGYGLNNNQQVVGTLNDKAFLYQNGSMIDLSELPEVKAMGWNKLSAAYGISDGEVIIGWGEFIRFGEPGTPEYGGYPVR
jgi:probable HAF family extracellular repeat protein